MQAPFDLILRGARLAGRDSPADLGVRQGRITAIEGRITGESTREFDITGHLVVPGFVDTHVHLDKACLLDRCGGAATVGDAVRAVSALKREFTTADVYRRGARALEMCIGHGTQTMRTHVEIDPRIGLRGYEAVSALRRDYRWAIDLQLCVFPQEGLTNDPGAEELLVAALRQGAQAIGGCPYMDSDPEAHIERVFDLAAEFDLDVDLHLDFDLDPSWEHLDIVLRQTERRHWQGRVAVGHATKLSAMPPDVLEARTARLAAAGIAVTVIPSTDLYLMGREATHNVPRGVTRAHLLVEHGVTCSVATNNLLNPFTPFGDGSLLRIANLYANVAHVGPAGFERCLELVTDAPARLMNLKGYGVAPGRPADFIVLPVASAIDAVAEIANPVMGFKDGRQTFERTPARLLRP